MRKQFYFISFLFIVLLSACNQKHFYNKFESVDIKKWSIEDTITFNTAIKDVQAKYNVAIAVRHSKDYEFNNLWLQVIETYNGVTKTNKVQIQLFKKDGSPYGETSGSMATQIIPLHQNMDFPTAGNYTIQIVQLMRKNPLDGIADIGIIMDKK